jgi:hypothetical protein
VLLVLVLVLVLVWCGVVVVCASVEAVGWGRMR